MLNKLFNKIGFKKISILFIVFLFLILTSYFYISNAFNIRFVDEEENIIGGFYLLKGQHLYSDIFLQHQPLSYLVSAIIQKIVNANSIYLLIKSHRIFIVCWTFVWSLFLINRFGKPLVGFIVIYELIKIYLFGNFFLAESLAIYPLIYLISICVFEPKKLGNCETFFVGVTISACLFLLSNLWPVLFFLSVLFIKRGYFRRKSIYAITGFALVGLSALIVVSIKGYFYDLFYINFRYYLPHPSSGADANLLKPFFMPIISFFVKGENTITLNIIRISALSIFISIIFVFKRIKKEQLFLPLIILGLTGIRYVEPGMQFYKGFHLLPWFSVLILLVFFYFEKIQFHKSGIKIINELAILFLVIVSVSGASRQLFVRRDVDTDYYVNYSRQFDFGKVVGIMKTEGDRLLVIPDDILIYWQADIAHASTYVYFYDWMFDTPVITDNLENIFENYPPQFFYCNCSGDKLIKYAQNYARIKKDGKETNLYVLESKIKDLSKEKWNNLNFYNISI